MLVKVVSSDVRRKKNQKRQKTIDIFSFQWKRKEFVELNVKEDKIENRGFSFRQEFTNLSRNKRTPRIVLIVKMDKIWSKID